MATKHRILTDTNADLEGQITQLKSDSTNLSDELVTAKTLITDLEAELKESKSESYKLKLRDNNNKSTENKNGSDHN